MSENDMPLKGIQLTAEFDKAKIFHIRCECADNDHSHDLDVEIDEHGDVIVNIYTKIRSRFWELSRWKQIWQILSKGYTEVESSILLSEASAKNYGNALLKTIKDFQNNDK